MGAIRNPSRYVGFGEVGDDTIGGEAPWFLKDANDNSNQIGWEVRHLGGCNLTYMDGRVEFARMLIDDPPSFGLPPFPQAFDPQWEAHLAWHKANPSPLYPVAGWTRLTGYSGPDPNALGIRQAPLNEAP